MNKALKYGILLLQLTPLLVKYTVLLQIMSNERFFNLVNSKKTHKRKSTPEKVQPLNVLNSQIEKIINILAPSTKCLVRSLVKKEVLRKHGYDVNVNFSIYKADNQFKSHAWILSPCMKDYKTLHTI